MNNQQEMFISDLSQGESKFQYVTGSYIGDVVVYKDFMEEVSEDGNSKVWMQFSKGDPMNISDVMSGSFIQYLPSGKPIFDMGDLIDDSIAKDLGVDATSISAEPASEVPSTIISHLVNKLDSTKKETKIALNLKIDLPDPKVLDAIILAFDEDAKEAMQIFITSQIKDDKTLQTLTKSITKTILQYGEEG